MRRSHPVLILAEVGGRLYPPPSKSPVGRQSFLRLANFSIEILIQMLLYSLEWHVAAFQAAHHEGAFEHCYDQRGHSLRIDAGLNFASFCRLDNN